MKISRRIALLMSFAGTLVVLAINVTGQSLPGTTGQVAAKTSVANAATSEHGNESERLGTEEISDVNVPQHLKGFELLKGSPERGAIVWKLRLNCLDCHSLLPGEETGFPNLADVGRRLTPKQIVTSILEPSRDFAEGYKSITVVTFEGRIYRGIKMELNDQFVILRTDRGVESISHDQIEEITAVNSDMPEGLINNLSPQEFADLLALLNRLDCNETAEIND